MRRGPDRRHPGSRQGSHRPSAVSRGARALRRFGRCGASGAASRGHGALGRAAPTAWVPRALLAVPPLLAPGGPTAGTPAEPGGGRGSGLWRPTAEGISVEEPVACPRCAAPLRIVAVITEPAVISPVLLHRARSAERARQARSPPPGRRRPATVVAGGPTQ